MRASECVRMSVQLCENECATRNECEDECKHENVCENKCERVRRGVTVCENEYGSVRTSM